MFKVSSELPVIPLAVKYPPAVGGQDTGFPIQIPSVAVGAGNGFKFDPPGPVKVAPFNPKISTMAASSVQA
jgi:hypothetical protein